MFLSPPSRNSDIMLTMDFQKIIAALMDAGITQQQIADRAGCTRPNIAAIKAGNVRQPSYAVGVKLLELYQEESRKQARLERRKARERAA